MLDHPFPIVIALGCNLGDRRRMLNLACRWLEWRGVEICRKSRLYWTRPWGVTDQPWFLNAAIAIQTRLRPIELLDLCLGGERALGRRRLRRWGERSIDLDLILYGHLRLDMPRLTLPHPRLTVRDFVLAPLADLGVPPPREIAPQGWGALLRQLPRTERTILHTAPWSHLHP